MGNANERKFSERQKKIKILRRRIKEFTDGKKEQLRTPRENLERALKEFAEAGEPVPALDFEFERTIMDTPLQPKLFTKEEVKNFFGDRGKKDD